jgi:hypothetical protein
MRTKLLSLAVAVAMLAGCAKLVVLHVPNTKKSVPEAKENENIGTAKNTKMEGVFYTLPKTVVRLGVKVNHTVAKAAPFMTYAAIFAPDGQLVCKKPDCVEEGGEQGTYELQQGATFATFGEPDPDHVYIVKFVGSGANDQTVSMTWTDTWLLSTASASVTNRTTDVVMSGLKLAAGLGTKAAYGAALTETKDKKKLMFCLDPSNNDPWIIPILQTGSTSLVANYCNMDVTARNIFSKPTDELQLKKATQAYITKLSGLINGRDGLLSGESPGQQPADILTRLEALINQQLMALYLGSNKIDTWEGLLDVRALSADGKITILYIDPKKGICLDQAQAARAPDSKPYPEKFNILNEGECKRAPGVYIQISFYPEEDKQLFSRMKSIKTPDTAEDRSFRYRIPAQVKAELRDDNKTYGVGVFSVAQLGVVASLPATRNSKSLTYELSFIEATGGLKTFKIGTTALIDSTSVDALSAAGGTFLDARNTARKADEASKDEVTTLTRQNSLLKMKDENCVILQKYGQTCTVLPQ